MVFVSTRKLTDGGLIVSTSAELKVGDIIEVHANQRIPADLVLLYTKYPLDDVAMFQEQYSSERINWTEKQTGN